MTKVFNKFLKSTCFSCCNIKFFFLLSVFLATSCALKSEDVKNQSVEEAKTVITETSIPQDNIVLSQGVEDEATVEAQDEDALTGEIIGLLEVRTFHFDFDSSALNNEDIRALNVHAEAIKAAIELGENFSIVLEGYTDERGTREYNLALGERRAESVSRYLRVNGVPANMLDTISYGEERPVALGSNEAAWKQNRRVEIKY